MRSPLGSYNIHDLILMPYSIFAHILFLQGDVK